VSREQIIRELRGILNTLDLSQHDRDTICAAIRALGGHP
jgi:hypothetical protein